MEALRQREPTAAERLVNTYGDRAYRLVTRITGNGQDAEEVVQDAFGTVVRKIDSFRGESAFGSWLFRIVANGAYQKLRTRRSRRRDVPGDEVLPVFDESNRHVMPIQTELWAALTAAINELPAAYRTVLVLRDVEGLSNLEIVEDLGLSIPAVETRVHRARLFLRKQLTDAMATLDATTGPKASHEAHRRGATALRLTTGTRTGESCWRQDRGAELQSLVMHAACHAVTSSWASSA